MKRCTKCGVEKEASEFWKRKSKPDGLRSECKSCERLSFFKWQRKNRKKRTEDAGIWHRNHPEYCYAPSKHKEKARGAFQDAVHRGKIIRVPCEVCGLPNAHGHHTDYSKPFMVKWLCRQHHMALHRKFDHSKTYVDPNWVSQRKLTRELAESIRSDYKTCIHQPTLAKKYGVHQTHVSRIVSRKSWV